MYSRRSLYLCLAVLTAAVPAMIEAQSTPRACTLTINWSAGALDGPQSFTTITAVLPNPDGHTVVVAQPQDRQLRIVSASDGRVVATLGRRGAGPGEFQTINLLSWRSDTLVVADKAQQRLTLFSPAGGLMRAEQIVSATARLQGRPAVGVALDSRGQVWAEPLIDMLRMANSSAPAYAIERLSRAGAPLNVVARINMEGSMAAAAYGSGVAVFVQPLSHRSLRAYHPHGHFIAVVEMIPPQEAEARFRVVRLTSAGDTILSRTYRYVPRRVTRAQSDSIYSAYALNFMGGSSRVQAERASREYVQVPAWQPPVSDVLVGSDGRVWLRREELSANTWWAVLNARGGVEAMCAAPSNVKLLAADQQSAWGTRLSSAGIPQLVRLDLTHQP
jgi:hypothetical protein